MDLIDQHLGDGTIEVAVEGELDLATAPQLRDWLLRSIELEKRSVTQIDFARCTFIDSTILGAIVEAAHLLEDKLQTLRITNLGGQPKQLIELTGVDCVVGLELEMAGAAEPRTLANDA